MWFDPVILNSLMLFCLVQSSVTLVQIYRFTGLNSPCKWFIGVGICTITAPLETEEAFYKLIEASIECL